VIDQFALIVGAMKSGTTSLFYYLSEHPAVARCSVKEPDFFAEAGSADRIGAYEDLWNWDPDRHEWALEASNAYAKRPALPDVAERIAEVDRTFKFIYCLRDPVDRIESHRAHNLLNGRWSRLRHIEETPHLVETTRYASQIDEYLEWFADDQVHLVKFERLVDEPRVVVDEILEFLGFERDVELSRVDRVHNPTRDDYRDRWLSRVLKSSDLVEEGTIRSWPWVLRAAYRGLLQSEMPSVELRGDELQWVEFSLRGDTERLRRRYEFDTSGWRLFS